MSVPSGEDSPAECVGRRDEIERRGQAGGHIGVSEADAQDTRHISAAHDKEQKRIGLDLPHTTLWTRLKSSSRFADVPSRSVWLKPSILAVNSGSVRKQKLPVPKDSGQSGRTDAKAIRCCR